MHYRYDIINTPLGQAVIMENDHGVAYIGFDEQAARSRGGVRGTLRFGAERQLALYFEGKLKAFDLPLYINGTSYQKLLFELLLQIPYGKSQSYGFFAENLGSARAAHAVGQAVKRNPLLIVVPCHRVLATHGFLGNYGSELWRKRFLLELENIPFKEQHRVRSGL